MSQYHTIGILSPVASPRQRDSEYYYTIVFPNTRAALSSESCSSCASSRQNQSERVSFADAVELLQLVTPGGKEREQQAVLEIRQAWVHKFRCTAPESSDTIPFVYFQELLREVIVQRFDAMPELFLKTSVSRDQQALLLSFRPSRALLADMADRLQMNVAVMPEIHPPSSYWAADSKRSKRENEQWTKPAAQEELYRLFLAGKIPTEEATLFDADHDREDQCMWSRRIHALRRFSDPDVAMAIEKNSQAPTMYLPFKQRASLRYLYRQIDGAGGMADVTPFRVVDKIRLTKAIIDAQFDCPALVQRNLLLHHCCAHTHHTDAIDTSIDVLRVQWGSLLSPWRLYRQGLTSVTQLLHYQPIAHIRNYFGEEIALYFAYVSFQTRALQLLSGLALLLLLVGSTSWASVPRSYQTLLFCLLNCLFIRVFTRKWELMERQLAAEWGVATLAASLDARPQFRGELKRCYITHHIEPHYPPSQRLAKRVATTLALSALTLGFLTIYYFLVTSSAWISFYERSAFNVQVGNVLLTLLTRCLGSPLAQLSTWTNDWENYKTQDDYDANLTLKYALMQSANGFSILVFMTLIRPFLSEDACNASELHMSCQNQAVGLLTAMLFVDLTLALWDLRSPLYGLLCAARCRKLFRKRSPTQGSPAMAQYLLLKSQENGKSTSSTDDIDDDDSDIDAELELDEYEGVMFDYAQVMMNLGFVVGFAAVQPLVVLLAWTVAVLQIRIDTYKLCHLTQRPFPRQKNSIGSWVVYLRALSLGSLLLNASMATMIWLQELTTKTSVSTISTLHDLLLTEIRASGELQLVSPEDASLVWRTETHALVIFVSFGVAWWLAGLANHADRSVIKRLHLAQQTHTFLANKYLRNLDMISDELKDTLPVGRVFLNGVHRYIVTGDKVEEDAADEVFDELKHLQLRVLEMERRTNELRAAKAPVGTLMVEVVRINILPVMDVLTKGVDSFIQLKLKRHGPAVDAKAKDPAPANTSVQKKSRSPQWNETYEFQLDALDATLDLLVFDWELVGQNRRIGSTSLAISEVVARINHELLSPASSPQRRRSITFRSNAAASPSKPEQPQEIQLTMASYELPLEMPEALLTGMQQDLLKHGHPRISLQCGVQLQELGRLLWQQQKLQAKIAALKAHEAQFFTWT